MIKYVSIYSNSGYNDLILQCDRYEHDCIDSSFMICGVATDSMQTCWIRYDSVYDEYVCDGDDISAQKRKCASSPTPFPTLSPTPTPTLRNGIVDTTANESAATAFINNAFWMYLSLSVCTLFCCIFVATLFCKKQQQKNINSYMFDDDGIKINEYRLCCCSCCKYPYHTKTSDASNINNMPQTTTTTNPLHNSDFGLLAKLSFLKKKQKIKKLHDEIRDDDDDDDDNDNQVQLVVQHESQNTNSNVTDFTQKSGEERISQSIISHKLHQDGLEAHATKQLFQTKLGTNNNNGTSSANDDYKLAMKIQQEQLWNFNQGQAKIATMNTPYIEFHSDASTPQTKKQSDTENKTDKGMHTNTNTTTGTETATMTTTPQSDTPKFEGMSPVLDMGDGFQIGMAEPSISTSSACVSHTSATFNPEEPASIQAENEFAY